MPKPTTTVARRSLTAKLGDEAGDHPDEGPYQQTGPVGQTGRKVGDTGAGQCTPPPSRPMFDPQHQQADEEERYGELEVPPRALRGQAEPKGDDDEPQDPEGGSGSHVVAAKPSGSSLGANRGQSEELIDQEVGPSHRNQRG